MANQLTINIGAAANDGTGDPLRTAFNEVNLNFANVWVTGLPNSNIQFNNNRILTVNTNANLVLAPNGTGIVQSNVSILPSIDRVYNLGSSTKKWDSVYANYLNIDNFDLAGDLTVGGNLTVEGNTIQIGNIVTDTKTIQLSNTASTANAATGSGITVGANDNIATILYNSTSNVWTTNIGITATGNITAPYFVGNGALLTGITSYSNANATSLMASFGSNTISTTGNITAGYFAGNGSLLTGIASTYGNANVVANLAALGSNPISTTGNISGNYFVGNGSQLTGIVSSYGNANVANYLPTFSGNISAGNVSASGNISGAYIKGNGSDLTNLPAPTVTQDISSNGAMSIMTYDGVIKYVNYATVEPSSGNITGGNISTTGNVTANYFIGDGSQLTNLPGGNATLPLANGTSNFNIATANGSANITANAVTYTFGTDSRLTVPAAANVPGKISALTAATGRGHDLRISAGNTNGCSVAGGDMYLSAGVGYGGVGWGAGNVNIVTGDRYSNDIGNTWRFDFFGNLTLPGNTFAVNYANGSPVPIGGGGGGGGNTGNVTFDDQVIQGTGDQEGGSGLYLAPGTASTGNLQYLRVRGGDFPTHIHLDTGNNAYFDQYFGDDNKYVKLEANGNIILSAYDGANTHAWTFGSAGAYGELVLPTGEGIIKVVDDSLSLVSLNTTTGNANSVYLGSGGGLGFNDQEIGGNWLEIFRSGTEPEIRVPVGRGNLNIQTAEGANVYNWLFDNTGNLTLPTDGYLVVTTGIIGSGASPAPSLSGFSSIATTGSPGNISASGNLLVSGYANITGNINGSNATFSGNITGNTAGFAIGYLNIPQVSFAANATIAATDAGKHYYSTSASNLILTVANNTSVSWSVGTAITVVNRGTGNITIAQGSGVSLYLAGNSTAGNRTISTYGMATLLNVATNVWMINGSQVT